MSEAVTMPATPPGIAYIATPYSRWSMWPAPVWRLCRRPGRRWLRSAVAAADIGLWAAWAAACWQAARLRPALESVGLVPYSPIAHGHPVSVVGGIDPLDAAMWMEMDAAVFSHARVVVVPTLPGYRTSRGVAAEMREADRRGIGVAVVDARAPWLSAWELIRHAMAVADAMYGRREPATDGVPD